MSWCNTVAKYADNISSEIVDAFTFKANIYFAEKIFCLCLNFMLIYGFIKNVFYFNLYLVVYFLILDIVVMSKMFFHISLAYHTAKQNECACLLCLNFSVWSIFHSISFLIFSFILSHFIILNDTTIPLYWLHSLIHFPSSLIPRLHLSLHLICFPFSF